MLYWQCDGVLPDEGMESMIRFENVCKKYKQQAVIADISFQVEKSNFVVFIGPSGCGKTTLLKMINRLIRPTSGKIYIGGQDSDTMDEIQLRRNMGYVIQSTGLFPHMTIRENIEIIPHLEKKERQKVAQESIRLMELVGLDPETFLDRYPTQLSGGQQQRVGVARAFACDPEIILMDEPFSALDPITRGQLQDELVELQTRLKKTVVFVTHDMGEAIKLADKICIVNKGRLLQYDTPENILKNPADSFVSEFVGKHRIWSTPELIRARDIMIERPVTVQKHVSILRCVDQMRVGGVDSLLVVSGDGRLEGVVFANDARGLDNQDAPAETILKFNNCNVAPDDSIIDVLRTMQRTQAFNAPVVNASGALEGLITRSSLVTTLSRPYLDLEGVL